jgi:hypothetical protein
LSYVFKTFPSVKAIPDSCWADLNFRQNIYFKPEFLLAFEAANGDITFNYILVFKNGKAVAFAYTQIITISIKTITKNTRMLKRIRQVINTLFRQHPLRVLFCGNIFLSGEYGIFLQDGENKTDAFKVIAKALKQLSKKTKELHALFVKDFEENSLKITNQLYDFDYASMTVEPNMIINLKPEWQSFKDYKSALKSKYRVKANKADSKSKTLKTLFFSEADIKKHLKSLQDLYQNTIDNADFNAQILNLETYVHLKSAFPEKFFVKGYFLGEQLVGFLSAMHNQSHLDAHFIGIDYTLNKTYAIYPRILNDYVKLGLEVGATQINLGRTASEIKSTLGAVPQGLTCYCRHKRNLPNLILKPFIANVKIKTFKQHYPFK